MRTLIQIVDRKGHSFCAGEKAPDDVSAIAEAAGWRSVAVKRYLHPNRFLQIVGAIAWKLSVPFWTARVPRGATVLVPYPGDYLSGRMGFDFLRRLKRRGCRLAVFVHDFHELRTENGGERDWAAWSRRQILEIGDAFVVHNPQMREWVLSRFAEQGLDSKHLVELGIFDYLAPGQNIRRAAPRNAVVVAGTLNRDKAAYTRLLAAIKDVEWRLYGPDWDGESASNVEWRGVFGFTEILGALDGAWGLVWDGDSIERCAGVCGEYLRVNNPHKTSLYLAAGLPVIVWGGAAIADFVRSHGVGIVVSDLRDLPARIASVTDEEYAEMARVVRVIGERLRKGEFIDAALRSVAALFGETARAASGPGADVVSPIPR